MTRNVKIIVKNRKVKIVKRKEVVLVFQRDVSKNFVYTLIFFLFFYH